MIMLYSKAQNIFPNWQTYILFRASFESFEVYQDDITELRRVSLVIILKLPASLAKARNLKEKN